MKLMIIHFHKFTIVDGVKYNTNPMTVVVSKASIVIKYEASSSTRRSKRSAEDQSSNGQDNNIVFTFGTGKIMCCGYLHSFYKRFPFANDLGHL